MFLVLVLVHGISLSQEYLVNLSSCTGASKVPSGTLVGIRLFEQSCSQPYAVMVGLAPELASRYLLAGGLTTFSPKASLVGGRVASLGGLAKLRPTFEVHNYCWVLVIEWYSDCP